jgi:hypothetical protein
MSSLLLIDRNFLFVRESIENAVLSVNEILVWTITGRIAEPQITLTCKTPLPILITIRIKQNTELEEGGTHMEKQCDSCGTFYAPDQKWFSCPDCGNVYCPDCAESMTKEAKDIEKLRDGDAYTRLHILCPSCSIEMMR